MSQQALKTEHMSNSVFPVSRVGVQARRKPPLPRSSVTRQKNISTVLCDHLSNNAFTFEWILHSEYGDLSVTVIKCTVYENCDPQYISNMVAVWALYTHVL